MFSWAVTAVFEVALDSGRCTCAGSRGLCGTAQTAPCSPGNSATSQRCCKAESKERQVRDTCHPIQLPHQTSTLLRAGYGPWLHPLCSSAIHALVPIPSDYVLLHIAITFSLAGMLFHPYQLPDQFAESAHAYLLSQMEWYHGVILSMKDEQGAGNVFHTVRETPMSQGLRAILSFPKTNTLGYSRKLQ